MANGTPVADVTSPEPTVSFESQTTAVEAEMAEAQKMKSGQNMGESRHPTSPSRNTRSEMERSVPTIPSRYAVTLIKGNCEERHGEANPTVTEKLIHLMNGAWLHELSARHAMCVCV
eukprot:g26957.t1